MIAYRRLTPFEREQLSRYLVLDCSYRQIALYLNRSASTITREIKRNQAQRWTYQAMAAQRRAQQVVHQSRKRCKLNANEPLRSFICSHLESRWSPQQIAKRLKILYPNDMQMHVSHETIYAYLYVHPRGHLKRNLIKQLRYKHKNRRVKDKSRRRSYPIQDYVSIDERPAEINDRKIAGHWEGDLVMGALNKSAIGTLVERKTRLTLLVKLPKKDAASVCERFTKKFNELPEHLRKSLTYDQGQEMADHKMFTKQTKVKVYFAHPHSPWERGTSENTNMLIRDFFPKGTDFSRVSKNSLEKVQDLLNDRPRKVLDFYTPREAFTKIVALES